jgi:hypothetical protein
MLAFFLDSVPSFTNLRTRVPSSHTPFEAGRPFFFSLGARSLPLYALTLLVRDRPAFSLSTVALLPESTSTDALVPSSFFLYLPRCLDRTFLRPLAHNLGCMGGLECLDFIFGKALTRAFIDFLAGRAFRTRFFFKVAGVALRVPNVVPVRAVFWRLVELILYLFEHLSRDALAGLRMEALTFDALNLTVVLEELYASALLHRED